MALHEKEAVRGNLLDDVYASTHLSVTIPKYKMLIREVIKKIL